jgi:hypothetical protein
VAADSMGKAKAVGHQLGSAPRMNGRAAHGGSGWPGSTVVVVLFGGRGK